MKTAKQIFDAAFAPELHRDPRSFEYRSGVLYALQCKEQELPNAFGENHPPYALGTAQCDAWFSGLKEGADLWAANTPDALREAV